MTALRPSAIKELEKIIEDNLSFVIQSMQGENGLYNDSNKARKEAFARLKQLCKKGWLPIMQNQLLIGKINMVSKILIDTNVLLDYLLEGGVLEEYRF